MKRNLFLVALAATALASCSQDEIMEVQQDAIKFNVVTENQTRAADVYCNNNKMTSFKVWADYKATTDATTSSNYINGDEITYANNKWAGSVTRYWPDAGSLTFYAGVNMPTTYSHTAGTAPSFDFTPETTVANQKDLLYAVATNQTKSTNTEVSLNFRHALSQIEFKARNTNAQMYVEIEAVQVGNAPSKGTFAFPTASTDSNIEDHTNEAGATETEGTTYNRGTWSTSDTEIADYTVDVTTTTGEEDAATTSGIAVNGDNTAVNLTISTHATESAKGDYSKSMLLVPNATANSNTGTTAWGPAKNDDAASGTYLAVKCKIYNIADAPGDESDAEGTTSAPKYDESDITLHSGWAIVPVSFKWEPGKKYIYTFIFGEGNGGYDGGDGNDPDPTPDTEEDPKPVLVPMTYNVTVDDFVKGSEGEDVDMKTEDNEEEEGSDAEEGA